MLYLALELEEQARSELYQHPLSMSSLGTETCYRNQCPGVLAKTMNLVRRRLEECISVAAKRAREREDTLHSGATVFNGYPFPQARAHFQGTLPGILVGLKTGLGLQQGTHFGRLELFL